MRQLYNAHGRVFRLLTINNGSVNIHDPVLAMYELRVVTGPARAESPGDGTELQVVDKSLQHRCAATVPSVYVSGMSAQEFLATKIRFPFSRAKASLITGEVDEPLIADFFPRVVRRLRRRISDGLGATQPSVPALPPPENPSGSAALNRPLTSPVSNTGACSVQPIIEPPDDWAPPAPDAPGAALRAADAFLAARIAKAAPSPAPPPSPPPTAGEALDAAKSRALTKRRRPQLLKTPQILMSEARGGAESPTAEGDVDAGSEVERTEMDSEDEPCEEDEVDEGA